MNHVFIPQPGSCAASRTVSRLPTPWGAIGVFAVASMVGGTLTASLLAAPAALSVNTDLVGLAIWVVAAAAAVVGVAADAIDHPYSLPQRHRQVPRSWVDRMSRPRCSVAFGFMLGAGFFTYLHRGSVYAVAALALVAPRMALAAALGATYGLGRAVPLLLDAVRSARRSGVRPLADLFGRRTALAVAAAAGSAFATWFAMSVITI